MIQDTITMTKLTASDGMILTNGETYGETVFLGAGDSPYNWREITQAEYEATAETAVNDGTER